VPDEDDLACSSKQDEQEEQEMLASCNNASYVYGPFGAVLTGTATTKKEKLYTGENYRRGSEFVLKGGEIGLETAVSTLAVVFGTIAGGPLGAVVLGGLMSFGCEWLRQKMKPPAERDRGRLMLATAIGMIPGLGKAVFSRLFWNKTLVKRVWGDVPNKMVRETGVKAAAKRTFYGAWEGAYYGGSLAYQKSFGFGMYDHLQQGGGADLTSG
jgi:hypothetical protein